jgi:hypothetical protein
MIEQWDGFSEDDKGVLVDCLVNSIKVLVAQDGRVVPAEPPTVRFAFFYFESS